MPATTAEGPELNAGDGDTSPPAGSTDCPTRKRKSRACDRCHRNACRCSPGIIGTRCGRCEKQGVECTYTRPVKRRGPPGRRTQPATDAEPKPAIHLSAAAIEPRPVMSTMSDIPAVPHNDPSEPTSSPGLNSETLRNPLVASDLYSPYEGMISPGEIDSVMQIFYNTTYPLLPYFHWPTFYSHVRQQLYRSDWATFVATMSVLALTIARIYSDGVQIPVGLHGIRSKADIISAECYSAAVKAMPSDITIADDYFPAMKASGLLAAASLQNKDLKKTVAYLGDYISLSVMHGFYDEANWPSDISEIERQERRRLFWGVYQQEQYIAINFHLPSRQCEAKTTVLYPAEVFEDEDITPTGIHRNPDRISFLCGWNYCTDLYRLFENVNSMIRAWQQASLEEPRGLLNSFLFDVRPSKYFTYDILNVISRLHQALPREVKAVKEKAQNLQNDWYWSIAVAVILTTHNIKILLAGTEKPNVHLRCAIASELLDEMETIPPNLLSTGSLHHLSHIGNILTRAIPTSLSNRTYLLVHNIVTSFAELIESVELSRLCRSNIGIKFRAQIEHIDQYREQSSENGSQTVPPANSQPLSSKNIRRILDHSNTTGASDAVQGAGFTGAADILQRCGMPNPGSDLLFDPVTDTSHTEALLANWPIPSGETDALDAVTAFLSVGSGTRDI